ncbi:hypothetical protein WG66_010133 [Moniliophthora roreri]|uniref:DUF7729 domain-containing protein n=1 Tax=Moniliophthora roreri TaxID=221103 RepID=A0A0W0FMX3_MONRR|nr:hypothetical protein WG66_010133 [Moniliophthora roreri]
MFTSLAIVSLLTSAAVAQSAAPSNPLIPSGISQSCSSFLNTLNNDSQFKQCTQSVTNATAPYGPGGDVTTPTLQGMTSTLDSLCSIDYKVCEQTIRKNVFDFYGACPEELTSNTNQDVLRLYEILYSMVPMKNAVCSKDDNGRYCVTKTSSLVTDGTSPSGVKTNLVTPNSVISTVQQYLWSNPGALAKRADAMVPNMTTYANTNLPFLFISPDLDYNRLCTACTRNVMTHWINFQSDVPYAPGLNKSLLLSHEADLYTGIQKTCGPNFMSGVVQAAGGLSDGSSNGSFKAFGVEIQGFVTIIFSIITMVATSAL